MNSARLELIRDLRERTRRMETAARLPEAVASEPVALEQLLLGQGFARGTLVEWQNDGEERQGGQLQAHCRQQPQAKGGADADEERHRGEDERDLGQGVNL